MQQKSAKVNIPISSEIQELETGKKFISKVILTGQFLQRKIGFIYYKVGDFHYKVREQAGMVS